MKATGIVRRIDDLGRVVIPKEIRRTMRIREGDPLEIYTNTDGEVIFKKYSAEKSWLEIDDKPHFHFVTSDNKNGYISLCIWYVFPLYRTSLRATVLFDAANALQITQSFINSVGRSSLSGW